MIHIPVRDLRSALTGLAKVVSPKATLDVLRCVRVDATPDRVTLTGTDLSLTATVILPEADAEIIGSFLFPLETLQSMARRLPSHSLIHLEAGAVHGDLGPSRITETVEAPNVADFPEDAAFQTQPKTLPETFRQRFAEALACSSTDETRYVLNGVALDVSSSAKGGHYLVGTDGRHLFSANSFTLPLKESLILPSRKLLAWRGLPDTWAMAREEVRGKTLVRLTAGNWTLTMEPIEGTYPNWRQVLVHDHQITTRLTFPEQHAFGDIIQALPGGDLKDKPVDIVVSDGTVAVKDCLGGRPIQLVDVQVTGADVTVRLNRDFLAKAFDFGLTSVGFIDAMSPLRFTREGRTLVVMPLRVATPPSPTNPTPVESQPERKTTMPETTVQTKSSAPAVTRHGAANSPSSDTKPVLEAAIEKLDAFKASVRESLGELNDLTSLLRQALRDQKTAEKEVQSVRQTLRSLQSVRI